MPEDLIVIGEYNNPFEAEMSKNRLEEEGIAAFVGGGAAAGVFSGMGLTMVQLYVPAADRDRAMTILASVAEETETATVVSPPPEAEQEAGWTICSRCGSEVRSD